MLFKMILVHFGIQKYKADLLLLVNFFEKVFKSL